MKRGSIAFVLSSCNEKSAIVILGMKSYFAGAPNENIVQNH